MYIRETDIPPTPNEDAHVRSPLEGYITMEQTIIPVLTAQEVRVSFIVVVPSWCASAVGT